MEAQRMLPFTESVLLKVGIGRRGVDIPVIVTFWVSDF
jgi:hypothetical protein